MTAAEKRDALHAPIREAYAAALPQHLSANELEMYRTGFLAAIRYASASARARNERLLEPTQ